MVATGQNTQQRAQARPAQYRAPRIFEILLRWPHVGNFRQKDFALLFALLKIFHDFGETENAHRHRHKTDAIS